LAASASAAIMPVARRGGKQFGFSRDETATYVG
jgi:hypothetical protein